MARRSLKALQQRIDTEANSGNNNGNNGGFYYPHWKLPKDGQTKLRIVEDPDMDNEFIVYRDFLEHKLKIDEDWVRIPCLKNLGKDHNCPICTHSSKLYKAGDDVAGKYYYRDMFAVLRGIIIKDGLEYSEDEESQTGKLRPFKFSYQLANTLKAEIGKLDEDDEFWNLEEGIDFIIEKQMVKGKNGEEYGKYDVGSGFARKPTDVTKYAEVVTDEPLSALLPDIPSYDEAAEILEKHFRSLRGESSTDDGDDAPSTTSEDEVMDKINRRKSKKQEASVEDDDADDPVVDLGEDDDDDSGVDLLAGVDLDDDDDDDEGDILAKFSEKSPHSSF